MRLAFALGHGDVAHGRFIQVAEIPQQVEQVGDRLQRIVHLVSDGGRQPSGRRQFFGLAQSLFAELALADVLHDQARPAYLVGRGADGIGAHQPCPRLARFQAHAFDFDFVLRGLVGEDPPDRVFQFFARGLGQQFRKGFAQVAAQWDLGEPRKHVVDPHAAAAPVKERQPDGRIGQHGIQQREGVVQPGSLLVDGGHHAIEGLDQVGEFVVAADRQREAFRALRRLHQGGCSRMEDGERLGDGTGDEPHQHRRCENPHQAEDQGAAHHDQDLLAIPLAVALHPCIAGQLAFR